MRTGARVSVYAWERVCACAYVRAFFRACICVLVYACVICYARDAVLLSRFSRSDIACFPRRVCPTPPTRPYPHPLPSLPPYPCPQTVRRPHRTSAPSSFPLRFASLTMYVGISNDFQTHGHAKVPRQLKPLPLPDASPRNRPAINDAYPKHGPPSLFHHPPPCPLSPIHK